MKNDSLEYGKQKGNYAGIGTYLECVFTYDRKMKGNRTFNKRKANLER